MQKCHVLGGPAALLTSSPRRCSEGQDPLGILLDKRASRLPSMTLLSGLGWLLYMELSVCLAALLLRLHIAFTYYRGIE